MPPPLVVYETYQEYLEHFKKVYCRSVITTADGIRVYFSESKFWHAFYERNLQGRKETFSPDRAKYIDWIKATLEHADAKHFQGWNSTVKEVEPFRRVSVVYESFVVVLDMQLKQDALKAKFVTAFYADRSINSIEKSPPWDRNQCLEALKEDKKNDR